MALLQTLIGNQRPAGPQQINPNLMALLSAIPRQRGGHYGMNGQEINPSAPTGLGAFYQMQQDRAQQLGGVAESRMFARDAMAKEQQARMNGGFIPQPPATNPQTQQAPANIWDQGYGTPGGQAPTPIAPQTVAPLHPAFNPHKNPSVMDQIRVEENQRWDQRRKYGGTLANGEDVRLNLDPESIAGRYFFGASDREMSGLYNQLEPGRQPDPAAYSRQAGINQRGAQDSLLGQMGQRGSNPFVSRMAPAPRVDRTQPIWKRLKDAGIY